LGLEGGSLYAVFENTLSHSVFSCGINALLNSIANAIHFAGLTENDGHEIWGQDIYRLKIDYITMQCAILFKTTAEYKS